MTLNYLSVDQSDELIHQPTDRGIVGMLMGRLKKTKYLSSTCLWVLVCWWDKINSAELKTALSLETEKHK